MVGFTKAYKRERPDATVKAVDFDIEEPEIDVIVNALAGALTAVALT